MDRQNYFFRQKVSEADLDQSFDDTEEAIQGIASGIGLLGLCQGGALTQRASPGMGARCSGPLVAYDQTGNRIYVASTADVPLNVDENSSTTTVSTPGHEKWLAVFVKFSRTLSDPRLDGNGATVFYQRQAAHTFVVVQGASSPAGTAARPALRADHVLLGDVLITYGTTAVLTSMINYDRTQNLIRATGSPYSLNVKTFAEGMQSILTSLNAATTLVTGKADKAGGNAFTGNQTQAGTNTFNGAVNVNAMATFSAPIAAGAVFNGNPTVPTGIAIAGTQYRDDFVSAMYADYVPSDFSEVGWERRSSTNTAILQLPIDTVLKTGNVITEITVTCRPGAARTGTNRMSIVLNRADALGNLETLSDTAYDAGTNVNQYIGITGLNLTVSRSSWTYFITVRCGNNSATAQDYIKGAIVKQRVPAITFQS